MVVGGAVGSPHKGSANLLLFFYNHSKRRIVKLINNSKKKDDIAIITNWDSTHPKPTMNLQVGLRGNPTPSVGHCLVKAAVHSKVPSIENLSYCNLKPYKLRLKLIKNPESKHVLVTLGLGLSSHRAAQGLSLGNPISANGTLVTIFQQEPWMVINSSTEVQTGTTRENYRRQIRHPSGELASPKLIVSNKPPYVAQEKNGLTPIKPPMKFGIKSTGTPLWGLGRTGQVPTSLPK